MRSIKFYTCITSHTIPHSQSHRTHRASHTPRHRSQNTARAATSHARARHARARHAVAPVAPVAHTVPVDPSRAPCARAGRWRSPSRANVEASCAATTHRFSRHHDTRRQPTSFVAARLVMARRLHGKRFKVRAPRRSMRRARQGRRARRATGATDARGRFQTVATGFAHRARTD